MQVGLLASFALKDSGSPNTSDDDDDDDVAMGQVRRNAVLP
jgi:hypothetical protein